MSTETPNMTSGKQRMYWRSLHTIKVSQHTAKVWHDTFIASHDMTKVWHDTVKVSRDTTKVLLNTIKVSHDTTSFSQLWKGGRAIRHG